MMRIDTVQGWRLLALAFVATMATSAAPALASGQAATGVTIPGCDGQGEVAVAGLAPGQALPRAEAQTLADRLMTEWGQRQGAKRLAEWRAETRIAQASGSAAPPPAAPAAGAAGQPIKTSDRDRLIWKKELDKFVAEGYKLYHSPTALGGTIGISCDMCHPDGSNTHPETYPKFQMQLKKVALLRDMINWCIENPEKGKPLAQDDERLRAVEAYILSTRKSVPLEPGKH